MLIPTLALLASASLAGESGNAHVLTKDQPVEVQGDSADLTLRWHEITDSRCPKGVQCIVAGQVQLRLAVEPTGRDAQEIVLVLGAGRRLAGGDHTAEVAGYRIELLSVDPYPEAGVNLAEEDRRATLSVESLQAGSE